MGIQTRLVRASPPATPGVIGKDGKPGKASGEGSNAFADLGSGTSFVIDFAVAKLHRISPSGNFTLSIANAPAAGKMNDAIVEVVGAEGLTCTLPADGEWGGLGEVEFSSDRDFLAVIMRNGEAGNYWTIVWPGVVT